MSKTAREIIDLKQEIVRVTDYNKQLTYLIKQRDIYNKELEKKLKTAVKALRIYADKKNWEDIEIFDLYYFSARFKPYGYEIAQKALKKIGIEK